MQDFPDPAGSQCWVFFVDMMMGIIVAPGMFSSIAFYDNRSKTDAMYI
jgi:hypothetical protein